MRVFFEGLLRKSSTSQTREWQVIFHPAIDYYTIVTLPLYVYCTPLYRYGDMIYPGILNRKVQLSVLHLSIYLLREIDQQITEPSLNSIDKLRSILRI